MKNMALFDGITVSVHLTSFQLNALENLARAEGCSATDVLILIFLGHRVLDGVNIPFEYVLREEK